MNITGDKLIPPKCFLTLFTKKSIVYMNHEIVMRNYIIAFYRYFYKYSLLWHIPTLLEEKNVCPLFPSQLLFPYAFPPPNKSQIPTDTLWLGLITLDSYPASAMVLYSEEDFFLLFWGLRFNSSKDLFLVLCQE